MGTIQVILIFNPQKIEEQMSQRPYRLKTSSLIQNEIFCFDLGHAQGSSLSAWIFEPGQNLLALDHFDFKDCVSQPKPK